MANEELDHTFGNNIINVLNITILIRVIGYALLLYGKKQGFYLVVIISIVDVLILLFGCPECELFKFGFSGLVTGLFRIGILYGVLQIKKNNVTAWNSLSNIVL